MKYILTLIFLSTTLQAHCSLKDEVEMLRNETVSELYCLIVQSEYDTEEEWYLYGKINAFDDVLDMLD